MLVQEYLKEKGIDVLQAELGINVAFGYRVDLLVGLNTRPD